MGTDTSLLDAKVVIVDDEPGNVRLLERLLAQEGYSQILGLTDSKRLLDEKDTLKGADLLLLDLHMPSPDGFELLETLRGTDSRDNLPILVLTADVSAASRNRALELGATDYVTKPFDAVEVALRVRNLLRTRFLHLRLLKTNRLLQDRILDLERSDRQ